LPEKDVSADGKGSGAEPAVEFIRSGAGVDTHLAEIITQAGAHLLLHGTLKELPVTSSLLDGKLHLRVNPATFRPLPPDVRLDLEFLPRRILLLHRRIQYVQHTETSVIPHDWISSFINGSL